MVWPIDPHFACVPGDLVLAQYNSDRKWYRARVLEYKVPLMGGDPTVVVFFIDYGNMDTITMSG